MNLKKLLSLALALLMLAGLLAGCGTPAASPTPTVSTAPTDTATTPPASTDSPSENAAPITLHVAGWWGGTQKDTFNQVFATYSSEHPGVTVQYDLYPYNGYMDKVAALAASGNAPDIIMMDSAMGWDSYLLSTGLITPLDSLIASNNYDTSIWLPGVKENVTIDGQIVSMPFHNQQLVTWVNADVLADFGIAPLPQNPTWDDIWAACKKIDTVVTDPVTGKDVAGFLGGPQQFAVAYAQQYAGTGIWQKSDGTPNYDDPNLAAALTQLQTAFLTGVADRYTAKPKANFGSNPIMTGNGAIAIYNMGQIVDANTPDAQGVVAAKFKQQVVNFPSAPGASGNAIVYSANDFGITTLSKNQDAAFKLLAWMTTDEALSVLVPGANVTPAVSGPTWTAMTAPQADKFPYDFFSITAATSSSQIFPAPTGGWWYSGYNTLVSNWGSWLTPKTGTMTPTMTTDDLIKKLDLAYATWKATQ